MFNSRSPKITQELRDVVIYQTATGLNFNYELILNEQIGTEMAQQCSVVIANVQRMLLDNCNSYLR